MQIFQAVANHYADPRTGEIAIDGYFTADTESESLTVAWVNADGEVKLGKNSKDRYLECENVKEGVDQAIQKQFDRKLELIQKLVDDCNTCPAKLRLVLIQLRRNTIMRLLSLTAKLNV